MSDFDPADENVRTAASADQPFTVLVRSGLPGQLWPSAATLADGVDAEVTVSGESEATSADSFSAAATRIGDVSGVLSIDGHAAADLADEFTTPVYVISETDFRHRAASVRGALTEAFAAHDIDVDVYYAGKSLLTRAVARWASDAGLHIDTCSLGEMRTALTAGIDPARIGLHGNNKSDAELELALDAGIGRIVIDSLEEVGRVSALAAARNTSAPVMLRITTGVDAGGHQFIATGHEDQKFGVSLASGEALSVLTVMIADPNLDVLGAHAHIGSQILDPDAFELSARRLLDLRAELERTTGFLLGELDLGGGFGIAYRPTDRVVDLPQLAVQLARAVRGQVDDLGTSAPRISFEPGRSISGPTTVTLYTVGSTKTVQGSDGQPRRYVAVDGGMSDNIRPALYGAHYTAIVASRHSAAPLVRTRVVGKHCESGDVVVDEVFLPDDVTRGDLLAVPATGAYGWSMASTYNHVPRPPLVATTPAGAREIVRRQTEDDILDLDLG